MELKESQKQTQVSMVNGYLTKLAQAYNGVKIASSINGIGRTELVHTKIKLDYQFISYSRINSKWIKDSTIIHDTLNILVENIDSKISEIPCSNILADISPRAREIK